MASLLEGAKKLISRSSPLEKKLAGLDAALDVAEGRLDAAVVGEAQQVLQRATERLRLSSEHTVVALAGATGSGKSSTFNALTGLDLVSVGVRRPTTSWATACTWGDRGAQEMLEWLGIPPRHQIVRDSMLDVGRESNDLQGLILLDLPDHDSTEVAHHLEVERLVQLADVLVWVVDPQKYADAAIHDRFLRPLADHADHMIIILNHIDEVPVDERDGLLADLKRILAADGLGQAAVFATSARTGEGIDELKHELARRVARKASSRQRLEIDLEAVAVKLLEANGSAPAPHIDQRVREELYDQLAQAAGVPDVVDTAAAATQRRVKLSTGWPLTAWLTRLRPDPWKDFHHDRGLPAGGVATVAHSTTAQVQQAQVEATIRRLGDDLTRGLSRPWERSVRSAVTGRMEEVGQRLDTAIDQPSRSLVRTPGWARLYRGVQWLIFLIAAIGAIWLTWEAVSAWLQVPSITPPRMAGLPLPTLMLIGGAGLGLVLAGVGRVLGALTVSRSAHVIQRQLHQSVAQVADELVLDPAQEELAAYNRVLLGLQSVQK